MTLIVELDKVINGRNYIHDVDCGVARVVGQRDSV